MTDAPTPPTRRSRLPWIAGALIALVASYAVVGFRVLPGIVRTQAIEFVRATYGRELQLGSVAFHPFLLQLELRDVALPDADGTTMLGCRRLFVDFEVASLWRRAYLFREVALDAPYAHAVRTTSGLNLASLAPPQRAAAQAAPDTPLPAIWIESLAVTDGAAEYEDRSRAAPLVRRLAPIAFALRDFRTTADGGGFSLAARTAAGEQLDWKGRFALEPAIASQGEFRVGALRMPGIAEFLGDALPFAVSAGTLDLGGTYRLTTGDTFALDVQLPLVRLADLALRTRGGAADWVTVPSIALTGVSVALPANTVRAERLAVAGLAADVWVAPDGRVNLQDLFAPARDTEPARVPMPTADGAPPPRASDERPWQVALRSFEIDDARLRFEDRTRRPVTPWTVAPLKLRVADASLDLSKPLPVELDARVNDAATLAVRGTVTPSPLATALDVSLQGARLAMLQPYVVPYADLTIRDGVASAKGRFELRAPGSPAPELSFAGDLEVANLRSTDNALNEAFFDVGRLQVQKLRYQKAPDSVVVDRVLVRDPYARFIVSRDAVMNVSAVLDPVGTAAALRARKDREAAIARETPDERRQRERLEEAAANAVEKQRRAEARKATKTRRAARAPLAPEKLPIRIREVRIDGGRLNFADFNVQPNFAADIRALAGTVTGLSSAPTSRAKLALTGNVGEFSPVEIAGELQPFAFDLYTDVKLRFANVSLPVFNPYSGRFAGYNIAKGKLDTEIGYRIVDRALDAQHHVRIDQLEWGEATPERAEASLPVKFATMLLRDRNGLIDLNLPIQGTLDDPKFRIGSIVWQVIRNVIVKAVTSPFALLGSLFGGSEDAQFVDFAPGASELDAAQVDRLAGLAKALVEKPGLQLDVPIGAVPALDGPALKERRFAQLRDDAVRAALKPKADAPLPAFDTLDPALRLRVLATLVQTQTGAPPKLPEPPPAPDGASRAEARALREAAALEFLGRAARDAVAVTDADYDRLGEERANAVQRALLGTGALEPSRVFLVRGGKVEANGERTRLELALK